MNVNRALSIVSNFAVIVASFTLSMSSAIVLLSYCKIVSSLVHVALGVVSSSRHFY